MPVARQLQFDVSALDQASKTFTRLGQVVERFEKRLDRLDGKRVDAEIGVDTKKADAEVGAFAANTRKKLQAALADLPEIEIDANSTPAQRELADIRRRMAELADKKIGIDLSAEEAIAESKALQRELDQLARTSPDIQVQVDAAAAAAKLAAIDAAADKLDGKKSTIKIDVDRSLSETLIQVAALGRALGTLALPAAAVAAVPQLAALGSAAVTAAGAVGLIPAAGTAAALSVGTLAVGFQNFGDAVGDDPDKAAEALGKLAPAAREAALAVREIAPVWETLRQRVQGKLFEGLSDEVRDLGFTYVPMLSDAMSGVAEAFNHGATRAAVFLKEASTVSSLRTMFADLSDAVENLVGPTLQPLTSAFVDIGSVGAAVLKDLTSGAGAAARSFADFTARARESGQMEAWIRGGVDALGKLASIAGNVGSALGGIFRASRESGADFLVTLDQVTAKLAELVNSAQGQSTLVSLFRDIQAGVQAALPGIEALFDAVTNVVRALGNAGVLQSAGAAFSAIAQQVAPLFSSLSALAPVVSGLLDVVGALAPVLTSAAIAFGAFWAAAKVVDGVQAIAGRVRAFGDAIGHMGRQASGGGALGAISTLGRSLGAGGVLGIGLAAAGIALQIWADRNAEAARAAEENKAKVDELANSFDKVTGSATAATREIKAQELTQVKLADGTTSLATALDQLGISSQTWVDATTGSIPAQQELAEKLNQVTQKAIEQSPAWRENAAQVQSWGVSLQDVVAAANGNVDAQNRLRDAARYSAAGITENERANSELVDTLIRTGGASGEVASRLGEAIGRYAEAKTQADQVREATASFTDGLKALGNEGLRVFAALAAGAPVTDEMAAGLQQVGESANTMALDVGRSTAAVSGVEQGAIAARDKMAGLRQQFIDSATAAGMAAPKAEELANELGLIPSSVETIIRTNATGVNAELITLNDQIAAVPAGKDVIVNAPTAEAIAQLDSLGFKVEKLPGGRVRIVAPTDEARANLDGFLALANSKTATMKLDAEASAATGTITSTVTLANGQTATMKYGADAIAADGTVQATVTMANGQTATMKYNADALAANGAVDATVTYGNGQTSTMKLNADPSQANSSISQTVSFGNGQTATMTYNANAVSANGTVTSTVQFADGQSATMTYNANRVNADGTINATVNYGNGRTATMALNARDLATPVIDNAARPRSTTITVRVNYVDRPFRPGAGLTTRATGAYAVPRAKGAYTEPAYMARGGVRQVTRTMSAARAEVVPANQPRVIGDRMFGPEAFIPINKSARSRAILHQAAAGMGEVSMPKEVAARLGYQLKNAGRVGTGAVGMADGGMLSAARHILGRMNARQPLYEDWTWKGAPAVVGQYNDALHNARERAGYSYANGKRFLEDYIRRSTAAGAPRTTVAAPRAGSVAAAKANPVQAAAAKAAQVAAAGQATAVAAGVAELRTLVADGRAQAAELKGVLQSLRSDIVFAGKSPDVVAALNRIGATGSAPGVRVSVEAQVRANRNRAAGVALGGRAVRG